MSILKRSVLVFCCLFVCLSSFLFSVSAVDTDYTFNFPVPNPANNFDGYCIVPIKLSNGDITADIFFWEISSSHTIDGTDVSFIDDLQVNVTVDNNNIYFDFITSAADSSFIVTLYQSRANGTLPLMKHSTAFVSDSSPYQPSVGGVTYYKCTQFSGVLRLTNNTRNLISYNSIFSDNNAEFNALVSVDEHFVSMLQKMDLSNEQLLECVSLLNDIYAECAATSSSLADFVYYYWEQFATFDLPLLFGNVTSRLDAIYRLLNKQGTVEQSTVDSSKVDEYADIEQSLVQNEDADNAIGDMNVSIDGQAYSFIWNLITDVLNTHPEVFGLVITILTLGFLALILNR